MAISGVVQRYYQNNVVTAKSTKSVNSTEETNSFAGKVIGKSSVSSEDMTLEEYKKYFNEKMNSLYTHPSQKNMNEVIDITDAAYERMKTDPAYEQKVLNCFATNKAVNFGSYIPSFAYTHVDDTWEKSYGYTQGMEDNVGYSGSSSAKSRSNAGRQKKARQKDLLEEYLEKRAEVKRQQQEMWNERIEKQEQEKSRLLRSWNNERLLSKASNAYEANVMVETVTDSASLLG